MMTAVAVTVEGLVRPNRHGRKLERSGGKSKTRAAWPGSGTSQSNGQTRNMGTKVVPATNPISTRACTGLQSAWGGVVFIHGKGAAPRIYCE